MQACPTVADYGPGGTVGSWRDLMAAAIVVRSMLGVSPSAYQDACEVMGPQNAAAVMACILARAEHINSAGGYLRELTARTRRAASFRSDPCSWRCCRDSLAVCKRITKVGRDFKGCLPAIAANWSAIPTM